MSQAKIAFDLEPDQALMLFEFLARLQYEKNLSIQHPAEKAVLSGLLATLEKSLTEPFRLDYPDLLEEARSRLCSTRSTG